MNQTLRPECSPAPGVGQWQSSALIPWDKPLLQRAQPTNVSIQSPSFLCPTWELPRYPKGAHSPQKWGSKQKRRRKGKLRTAGGLFPLSFLLPCLAVITAKWVRHSPRDHDLTQQQGPNWSQKDPKLGDTSHHLHFCLITPMVPASVALWKARTMSAFPCPSSCPE